jgi:hypothetical protein
VASFKSFRKLPPGFAGINFILSPERRMINYPSSIDLEEK